MPFRREFLGVLAVLLWAQSGGAQEIRARVVDDPSRSGLEGAVVVLLSSDSTEITRTATGPDGFFQLSAPEPGSYVLRVEHLGHQTVTRSVSVRRDSSLIPAFVLPVTAILLDTLDVEVSRGGITPHGVVGFSRASYLLAGERMAELEKTGITFTSAIRELGAGLRFRSVMVGERALTCIESSRRTPSFRGGGGNSCAMVAIIIDGVDTGLDGAQAMRFVRDNHIYDFESMEYVSSVEAGSRYGMRASDRGALVLWTRGHGPHRSEARGGGRT